MNKWIEVDDIPNIDAQNVFHRDLGKPLVTRAPTGKWYVHPALDVLPVGDLEMEGLEEGE